MRAQELLPTDSEGSGRSETWVPRPQHGSGGGSPGNRVWLCMRGTPPHNLWSPLLIVMG